MLSSPNFFRPSSLLSLPTQLHASPPAPTHQNKQDLKQ